MSRRRISPLPLKGIDARSSLGVSQETIAYAENMRASTNALEHLSNHQNFLVSPSGSTEVARDITQFFMSPPGGPDQNRLVMFTNKHVWMFNNTALTWGGIDGPFTLPSLPVAGGAVYPRFAYANSAHKLVWCSLEAGLRVRVMSYPTVTPIAQDYSGQFMIAFNHRILIADTLEAGVRNGSRIRWCANRHFDDWTGLSSGFLEVGSNTSSGSIRSMVNFDETALVSLENELVDIVPTGSLFPVFEEGTHYMGVSIFAPRSWATFNHVAYFLAPDGIKAWDRNKVVPIGRPVDPLLAPLLGPRRAVAVQGLVVPARAEYQLLVAEGASWGMTGGSTILIYDINADRWFLDKRGDTSAIGKMNTLYQVDTFVEGVAGQSPMEFTVRSDGFDRVGLEETASRTINGQFITQDFFALDANEQPSINAKNDFLALFFQTRPNTQLTVGVSVNGGASFFTAFITSNAEGYANFSYRIGFSRIRFLFQAINGLLFITGPLQMEYDAAGDTY